MKELGNILELSLAARAEMAFKAAVENVIRERMAKGLTIHVWRDGKVLDLSPGELRRGRTRSHPEP